MNRALVLVSVAACAHPAPVTICPPPQVAAALPPAVTPQPAAMVQQAPAPEPSASGYDKPPQYVLDVLHAPSPPQPVVSPTHDTILLVSWVKYPPIAQVAEPYLRLAGVRVEPRTRRKHDTPGGYGVAPCAQTLSIVDVASTNETAIALPPGGCVDGFSWAADGKRFAFRNTASDAVELWIGDTAGAIHRLGNVRLDPMLGDSHQWMPDQKSLLVKLVPEHLGAPPVASATADGPSIQETDGKGHESSTYEARDTLQNKHDEELFDYYATSQLALVDAATGAVTPLGKPAVLTDIDAAPDNEHILVTSIKKPYSYEVTYGRFAHDVEVWDRAGNVTKVIAKLPIADSVPIAGEPTGPRDFSWRSTVATGTSRSRRATR